MQPASSFEVNQYTRFQPLSRVTQQSHWHRKRHTRRKKALNFCSQLCHHARHHQWNVRGHGHERVLKAHATVLTHGLPDALCLRDRSRLVDQDRLALCHALARAHDLLHPGATDAEVTHRTIGRDQGQGRDRGQGHPMVEEGALRAVHRREMARLRRGAQRYDLLPKLVIRLIKHILIIKDCGRSIDKERQRGAYPRDLQQVRDNQGLENAHGSSV